MKAMVKCSNCGAEITNLNFSVGKKYWLWMIPVFALCLLPMWQLYRPRGNYRNDLDVQVLETRKDLTGIEILGTIRNAGKATWENIHVEAEFFGPDGKFLDEASGNVPASVGPGATEHFKMWLKDASERCRGDDVRMDLKVASAFTRMF